MKIIESYWFSNMTSDLPVGIVIMKTSIGELKAYIGNGYGFNREYDENRIAEWGAPFPAKQLNQMLKHLGETKIEGRVFKAKVHQKPGQG